MGMFSSSRHPVTGDELQFKTGYDQCEWFEIGDPVPQRRSSTPGEMEFADGFYEAISGIGPYNPDYIAVIVGGVLVDILPSDAPAALKATYEKQFAPVDDSLWSEAEWWVHDLENARWALLRAGEEYARLTQQGETTREERVVADISHSVWEMAMREGFAMQIFDIRPLDGRPAKRKLDRVVVKPTWEDTVRVVIYAPQEMLEQAARRVGPMTDEDVMKTVRGMAERMPKKST